MLSPAQSSVLKKPQLARFRWLVTGQVQGVGFRPFVYRAARKRKLVGFVRNDVRGVEIECQGQVDDLVAFEHELIEQPPAAAALEGLERSSVALCKSEREFLILTSESAGGDAGADVKPDLATCPDCVRELLSERDRRHRYPLINCTQCGPRFSIIRRTPYDRCNTTMRGFQMCPECGREYTDPVSRRFHAQPIACHECGPELEMRDTAGTKLAGDPIDVCRKLLMDGRIVAIKGIGGFHLAVRADDEASVQRLRTGKQRNSKPFALMVASLAEMSRCIELSDAGRRAALSAACPIVLGIRSSDAPVCDSVAPGSHRLGVMLPYTPVHHLLFRSNPRLPPLVMTSGNASDEPLAIDNDEACHRLAPLCDAILLHDRPIQRGVDDSVIIDIADAPPIPLRRARGYAPDSIKLPVGNEQAGLCVGAELKNTVAVVRHGTAILSQHLGDLTNALAFEAFRKTIDDFLDLFGIHPAWIAHDLHPMYLSAAYARQLSSKLNVPLIGVQHHHAHAASVMAEHAIAGPVLAVVCDGTGYGEDGTIWGGELLLADLCGYRRVAHLRPLPLAGGDAAARDTRRCALALLEQAFGGQIAELEIARALVPNAPDRDLICRMIASRRNCVMSSGAGRVFDGVSALLGLCSLNTHEAQAAMALEAAAFAATDSIENAPDYFEIHHGSIDEISFDSLIRQTVAALKRGERVNGLAMLFHEQFSRAWAKVVLAASHESCVETAVLSGGVFCNAIVTRRITALLETAGLRVLRNTRVPPNDGGIALGQAAIASARFDAERNG